MSSSKTPTSRPFTPLMPSSVPNQFNNTNNILPSSLTINASQQHINLSALYQSIGNSRASVIYDQGYMGQSYLGSKQQTPMKAPSPDHARMNMITPTKVKYLEGAVDSRQQLGWGSYTPHNSNNNIPGILNSKSQNYSHNYSTQNIIPSHRALQKQIQILTAQNRNLVQKLSTLQSPSPSPLPPSTSTSSLKRNQSSTLIIQRIKQQYEQKLSTLRLMIQQQIRQAMNVVEDMCQVMKNKLVGLESRIEGVEDRIMQVKVSRIVEIDGMWRNGKGRLADNLSDILCVSIPEEEDQDSRSHNTTQILNPLESQIDNLRNLLTQTTQSYQSQKHTLTAQLTNLKHQITSLTQNLQEKKTNQINLQSQLAQAQSKNNIKSKPKQKQQYQRQNIREGEGEGKGEGEGENNRDKIWKQNIKEELLSLQGNLVELVGEIQGKEGLVVQLVGLLDQKGREVEGLSIQLLTCKDKILQLQKSKISQQQRIRSLQQQKKLLQSELNLKKQDLQASITQAQQCQQQYIIRLQNIQTANPNFDKYSLLEQSERIKRMLEMGNVGEDGQWDEQGKDQVTRIEARKQ